MAIGHDLKPGLGTAHVCSITDRALVVRALQQLDCVIYTASLLKLHIVTHSEQKFIDTNITGTYTLLEAAETCGVTRFVMSSAFGAALMPSVAAPAAWIDETVTPVVKNIYGFSKVAAKICVSYLLAKPASILWCCGLRGFLQSLMTVNLCGAVLLIQKPRPTNFSIAG